MQSCGLDFFEDLPYFVAMLAIMNSFDEELWGQHRAFVRKDEPLFEGGESFTVALEGEGPGRKSIDFDLDINPKLDHTPYGLFGRGTVVLPVTSSAENPLRPGTKLDDDGVELVAKIYYPEQTRTKENDLLNLAYAITEREEDVDRHLPMLIASKSWEDKYAGAMADQFGVKDETGAENRTEDQAKDKKLTRSLRILVFVKLHPVKNLNGIELLKAFRDCVFCKSIAGA